MTARQVSKITGYTVRAIPPEDAWHKLWYGAFDENANLVAKASDYQPRLALVQLLDAIYRMHAAAVFQYQEWRCADCRSFKPLQCHHRLPRSKGRDDRVGNLIGLCAGCHERRHKSGRL